MGKSSAISELYARTFMLRKNTCTLFSFQCLSAFIKERASRMVINVLNVSLQEMHLLKQICYIRPL